MEKLRVVGTVRKSPLLVPVLLAVLVTPIAVLAMPTQGPMQAPAYGDWDRDDTYKKRLEVTILLTLTGDIEDIAEPITIEIEGTGYIYDHLIEYSGPISVDDIPDPYEESIGEVTISYTGLDEAFNVEYPNSWFFICAKKSLRALDMDESTTVTMISLHSWVSVDDHRYSVSLFLWNAGEVTREDENEWTINIDHVISDLQLSVGKYESEHPWRHYGWGHIYVGEKRFSIEDIEWTGDGTIEITE